MSNIKNYIDYTVRPDTIKSGSASDVTGHSTKDMLADLYKLRPPLWTVVGGMHATGVSRMLEELARMRGKGAGSQETLHVVLPDEESKRIAIGRGASLQRLELLKALRRELCTARPLHHRPSQRQILRSSVRDPNCENLFGEVRALLNQAPISRVVFDNAHYLRHDLDAVKYLFRLRRVVNHPFVMIFGVRLTQAQPKTDTIFSSMLKDEDASGAQETREIPRTLYAPAEDQLIEPILMELLAGQYALPTDELIIKAPEYTADLKKAVARNWVRLDVLAMRVDEKLREVDPRPRSQDHPGMLTYKMLREILDKMLGK